MNALDTETNAVTDVCKRGFTIPDGGAMEVAVGNIRVPDTASSESFGT